MRRPLVAALLFAAAPVWAQQTTLGYDAFVGGAKVGGAEIKIDKDDARYEINGKAWTVGVMNFVTQWQGVFSSTGRLADSGPVNEAYRFVERARDKIKEVMYTGGQLTYVKNGRVKATSPLTSLDLLSALFVSRDCASAGSEVNNGKDPFSLKLTHQESLPTSADGATQRCTFEVNGKDHERIDATIWLGQVDGMLVPFRLDLAGALEGTVKLHAPASGSSADSPTPPRAPTIQI
ncbi:MAG TPA: DUF3108 domain-containing protein [Pseudomonadales bacterium]|nr:DUF3108 domain-containing protein [Pseudomonadales bacterium]